MGPTTLAMEGESARRRTQFDPLSDSRVDPCLARLGPASVRVVTARTTIRSEARRRSAICPIQSLPG
jgi:hypothetical protein